MATTQVKNGFQGGTDDQLKVNTDGSINVNVSGGGGSPVSTNITEIGGSPISLGQTTEANSLPVTIASNQSSIPVSATQSGTWNINALTSITNPVAVTQSGSWSVGRTWDLSNATDSVASVQSGIWNIASVGSITNPIAVSSLPSIPAGTNAIGSVSVSNFPSTQPISGSVSVSNFPATQPISGTVTANAGTGTFAISAASLPLPTGAATNAELVTINSTLGSPFQAGGSIGNTAFGISGSLPAGSNAIGSVSVSNFPATQPISGTVAVTQSTSPWVTKDASDGPVTPGSAASNSSLMGGQYNSTLPTLTNAQQSALQVDSSGRLIVNDVPSSLQSTGTISALNGSVVIPTAGYGTVVIDITGTWVGTLITQTQTGDGNWNLALGSYSYNGLYVSSTTQNTSIIINCAGLYQVRVFASAWTSGTANISWNVAPGTKLLQAYQVASPANLLTNSYTLDGAGNQIGSSAASGASLDTYRPDLSTTGTLGALNATLNLPISNISSAYALISGTWVGTIQFQGSVNGSTFVPLEAVQGGPTNAYTTAGFTANGGVRIALPAGFTSIQAVMMAYTSGTATVVINTSASPANVEVVQFNASNLKTTANLNDGSGNSIASYNSQLDTADIINNALSSGSITVGTTAVAARVGASNLANRKMLMISPLTQTAYIGSSSSVTTGTGIPIYPGQTVSFSFSANVTPYLISGASGTVNIFEAS